MRKTFVIDTESRLQSVIGELRNAWKQTKYLRLLLTDAKPRSNDQNSLSHHWYAQIAMELGDRTEQQVKRECKLRFGVPILRADDEGFRELYDARIKPLSYEAKVDLMELIPVTSLMDTGQLSRYLEAMQKAYAGSVKLEFPAEG